MDGIAHYPVLCFDPQEVERMRGSLDPRTWLAQAYVVGQSHYLCGYLSSQGRFAFYWQTNLIQQPGGKSIVLAKTGQNPGLDEGKFFSSLAKKGYRGPLMMEIIQTSDRSLFFIEINPRFWGPLQLGVDACPGMIDLYLEDAGLHTDLPPAPSMYATPTDRIVWYAWKKGAQAPSCHLYPAAREISGQELPALLTAHDVYNRDDSRRLHGVH